MIKLMNKMSATLPPVLRAILRSELNRVRQEGDSF
jgi:hypothetical protein